MPTGAKLNSSNGSTKRELNSNANLHVVTENGEQCFMWRANQLTYIAQDRKELPLILATKFGLLANKLDLSYNTLISCKNISLFINLNELILDNNQLDDEQLKDFRLNLRLKILSMNKNRLNNLTKTITVIKNCFPNLEFLSLIGNPLCPSSINISFSSSKGDLSDGSENLNSTEGASIDERQLEFNYQRYRYFIIYHMPNLRFLDSKPISNEERDEALKRSHLMANTERVAREIWRPSGSANNSATTGNENNERELSKLTGAGHNPELVQAKVAATLSLVCLASSCCCLLANGLSKGNSKEIRASSNNKTLATNCDKTNLDSCVTTLMVFGRRNVYLPQNQEEMVPHCREEFEAEDCVKNFAKKCLSPFERQVAGMLILGAGQVLRKRCASEGTKEYLSHYKCIKKTIPFLHDAMDQLIYTLMEVSENHNVDSKIPTSCCAFARFQDYANKLVHSNCNDFDQTAVDYIGNKMIKGYVSDVLDLSCQGYGDSGGASATGAARNNIGTNDNDKCFKVQVPHGGFEFKGNSLIKLKQVNQLPANKPNSVVLPFLNIFTNL